MPKTVVLSFNKISKELRSIVKDGVITRQERRYQHQFVTNYRLRHMIKEVFSSKSPLSTYRDYWLGDSNKTNVGFTDPVESSVDSLTGLSFNNCFQGFYGSCTILSSALDNCRYWNNGNGTTTFRFFGKYDEPVFVTVKNERAVGGAAGFGGMVEIAYAKYLEKTGQVALGKTPWQEATDGNFASDTLRAFRGGKAYTSGTVELPLIEASLAAGKTVIMYTDAPTNEATQIVTTHAYRVVGITDQGIRMFNPWGTDFGKVAALDEANDGYVTVGLCTLKTQNWYVAVSGY